MYKRKFVMAFCLALLVAVGLNAACTKSQTDNQSAAKPIAQLTVISGAESGIALLRSTRFR